MVEIETRTVGDGIVIRIVEGRGPKPVSYISPVLSRDSEGLRALVQLVGPSPAACQMLVELIEINERQGWPTKRLKELAAELGVALP